MIFRWTKKLGVWGWITVAVGGFVLTLVMVVGSFVFWQRNRVETMFARIRAAGEPVTAAEFDAMLPALPPDRDATRLWLDGFAANGPIDQMRFAKLPFVGAEGPYREWKWTRSGKSPFVGGEPPAPGSDWPELALAEEYLADHAEALKLFHEAAKLGGAARLCLLRDLGSFDFRSTKNAAWLLLVESQVHAHKGQVGPTAASLQAVLAVGKACGGSPFLFSIVARRVIDASATAQILRLLPRVPFSDAQLAGLQSTFRAIDYREEFLHSLLAERVYVLPFMKDPTLLGAPPSGARAAVALALIENVTLPHYLETAGELIAAVKLPWPEALEKVNDLYKPKRTIPYYSRLEAMATPRLESIFQAAARGTARNRLADIALAAQRYRLANGRLPEALDDLVPDFLFAIPLDPFTNEPLHYVPTDDGFVVYSVGVDRKDDGGPREALRTHEPDLGYRIQYPAAKGEDVSTE